MGGSLPTSPLALCPSEKTKPGKPPCLVTVGEDKNREPACLVSVEEDKNREPPFLVSVGEDKNRKNPLQRMGLRPAVRLPLWSYKSKLLTPKPKACQHLLTEGIHPLQGDKQK